MPLKARIRFGALPSRAIPRVYRDDGVDVWCDFTDLLTGAAADVSDVTVTVWNPNGAEVSPAIEATEESTGVWRALVTPQYSGTWSIAIQCDTPERALDRRDFVVEALSPDPGPAPDPEWPVLEDLVASAEAAETGAVAAQAAAESAAAGANGVLTLAGVAGGPTAFTSTTNIALTDGLRLNIVFNVDPGASPTIKPGSQTTRSIRQADTSAILDGMLKAGVTYDGQVRLVTGVPVLCILNIDDEVREFTGRTVIRDGLHNVSYQRTKAGGVVIRETIDTQNGEIFRRVGGGGEEGDPVPPITDQVEASGIYRNFVGVYDGPAALGERARVLTENRPSLTYSNTKRMIGAPFRSNSRTAAQRLVISATGYYQLGGLDQHRDIVIANLASGSWLDFQFFPKGATANIICEGSAVVHLYCGEGRWSGDGSSPATLSAHSWVNDGSKRLTGSAGAWLRVRRSNTTFLAIADNGTVGTATASNMPAADLVVGHGPQSWSRDLRENGAAGAVPTMEALGMGSNYCCVDTASVGGSSLLYFTAKATLSYWNAETDAPTQRLDDMVAAILADHTARTTLQGSTAREMDAFVWCEGLNLMGYFGPTSTHPYNNPAAYTASIVKACQYLNAETGYDMVHVLIPLTSQKLGAFDEELWYAVRMAQLRAVAAGAAASPPVTIVIAPEIYGDPRAGDEEAEEGERHYDYNAHAVQMERVVMEIDNALNTETNHIGPEITGVESADSGAGLVWNVKVLYGDGRAPNQATRPDAAGFRMLPEATGDPDVDDFLGEEDCLAIRDTRWTTHADPNTIALRVTLVEPYTAGTPRPCVLYGSAEATEEASCLVYTLHPTTSKLYYLRQYLYA